jgi:arylsulfatase
MSSNDSKKTANRGAANWRDSIQRDVLPIHDRKPITLTTYDAKDPDTKFQPITPLRPPAGAPNFLLTLLDDVGFGASSRTPTAERLAADGLRYNRFHTTTLSSPTRAAFLTGRNHHAVAMGGELWYAKGRYAEGEPTVQLFGRR